MAEDLDAGGQRFLLAQRPPADLAMRGRCQAAQPRTCIQECPVDCIYEGGRMSYIHPDE
jgi:NAD-dependent dihydropyrimidine dehydrogenase PreA subunit